MIWLPAIPCCGTSSYWRAPLGWGTPPYGGASPYCEAPYGRIASVASKGFAPAAIMNTSTIETTQKDTTSDALFTKNLPFCSAALYDGGDRNNLATFSQP